MNMIPGIHGPIVLCGALCVVAIGRPAALAAPTAEEGHIIATLHDFEQNEVGPWPPLTIYRWTEEQKGKAETFTAREVRTGTPFGKQCLRVQIDSSFPWDKGNPLLMTLSRTHFPPEADAIRMRVKILKGTVALTVGGPTAYYGNSDAYARTEVLDAQSAPDWVTVEFSLNHRLWRNNRRAGFSSAAPRIYYTRWAQEPTGFYALPPSAGEMLIDQVELIAKGEGRPFPDLPPDSVDKLEGIADFEQEQDLAKAFTVLMADNQDKEFTLSWTRDPAPRYPPPVLSIVNDEQTGRRALSITATFAEEILWAGIKARPRAEANAICLTVRAARTSGEHGLHGYGPREPIDVAVWVAPPDEPFPWEAFGPAEELRAGPGPGYDYNMTYRTIRNTKLASFALYQARRFLKPGEWETVSIPFADFTCFYGHGKYADRLRGHMALTGDDIIAVAFLAPWPRTGRGETTILIDELSYVRAPGEDSTLRSFWQVPDIDGVYLWTDSVGRYGGNRHMLPKGEKPPAR